MESVKEKQSDMEDRLMVKIHLIGVTEEKERAIFEDKMLRIFTIVGRNSGNHQIQESQ